jgi:hypothetical protein
MISGCLFSYPIPPLAVLSLSTDKGEFIVRLSNLSCHHGSETGFFHRFYGYHCTFANLNTFSVTDSAKKLGFSVSCEQGSNLS